MLALNRRNSLFDIFDDVLHDAWLNNSVRKELTPMIDVISYDDNFVVEMEVPGVAPENIDVSLNNGILTVRGEKKREKIDKGKYERLERYYGSFSKSYKLPVDAHPDDVKAKCVNGVLTVTIPRKQKVALEPKKIKVITG